MRTDHDTIIATVQAARRVLGEYVAPGPRDTVAMRLVTRQLAALHQRQRGRDRQEGPET